VSARGFVRWNCSRCCGRSCSTCVGCRVLVVGFRERPCGLMDKALVLGTKDCRFESCQGHVLLQLVCFMVRLSSPMLATQCQFAREVKGVDLRSTAGNCAWVRTPQLAISDVLLYWRLWRRSVVQAERLYSSVVERQSCKLKVLGSIPSGGLHSGGSLMSVLGLSSPSLFSVLRSVLGRCCVHRCLRLSVVRACVVVVLVFVWPAGR
jgi:hypothetical protein